MKRSPDYSFSPLALHLAITLLLTAFLTPCSRGDFLKTGDGEGFTRSRSFKDREKGADLRERIHKI